MIGVVSDGAVGVLLLGLVIGMQHALEADHVAAVSCRIAKRGRPAGDPGKGDQGLVHKRIMRANQKDSD